MTSDALAEVLAEATGRGTRHDPAVGRSGGPAGNARLTSWLGLAALVLIAAELVTLLDVTGLVGWHAGLGAALVAVVLAKTASTTWRVVRYYTGHRPYISAGPPPTVLRMLGPLVVLSALAVLGTGLALVALGQDAARAPWFDAVGHQVSPLTLHQASFIGFGVLVGVHALARIAPAVRHLTRPASLSGRSARLTAVLATAVAAVLAAVLILPFVGVWHSGHDDHGRPPNGTSRDR